MGNAYPDVVKNRDFIVGVLDKEEERFRQTLQDRPVDPRRRAGAAAPTALSGSTAFLLHDTYGFPLELTQEIAGERGVAVDLAGFDTEMTAQRERAKAAPQGRRRRRRRSTPTARSSSSSAPPSSSATPTTQPRRGCWP